jgi:hypothetical protein
MDFTCNICNKSYKSYQSRWNHVNKYHTNDVTNSVTNVTKHVTNCNINLYNCKICNEKFNNRQSKWRHEKICKNNLNSTKDDKIEKLEKEIQIIKEELLKAMKIHPRTLQKINKQLNNSGTINNNNITNNINFLVQLGFENLNEALSEKEKINILMSKAHGLREIINLVHISDKYKQFNNVYITNLQNSIGYKYDTKTNNFIAVNKSELLDDIIECRMIDIEIFYSNLEDKLDVETAKIVKRFINRMNDENDPLKGLKKEEIKLLLYNSRDKILDKKKELEI